ncbi:MAG: hypothetical protein NWS99_01945 [Paracoccaceae bacterium]|jgi:Flp pilus assembly protein TadD|nr:hypothetical protein [Paracoccaceae bacterium]MDP5344873.1 hypothetical protein [Paracoccaceae bacterium]
MIWGFYNAHGLSLRPLGVGLAVVAALAGCTPGPNSPERDAAMAELEPREQNALNALMMSNADPNEAASYFAKASAQNPNDLTLQRGHARALTRLSRLTEANAIWAKIIAQPSATEQDRLGYADALIRANQWDKAASILTTIPPTLDSFERYRLEAMVADSQRKWIRADSFYETAVGLTPDPSGVLNNWGYSKLTRGDFAAAERLFIDALNQDPDRFTTKNNLVIARAAQGKYVLPVIRMSQTERAELLYTSALAAIKKGDLVIGKSLLRDAIDSHPQYFEPAERALRALEDRTLP